MTLSSSRVQSAVPTLLPSRALAPRLRRACVRPLLWLFPLLALSSPAQQFTSTSFGASAGLSNLNINTILEDRSGVLWVGTENGVFAADGPRFEKSAAFLAAGVEDVRVLREDAAGRLWATETGSVSFLQNGVVHSLPLDLKALDHEVVDLQVLPAAPDTVFLLLHAGLLVITSPDAGKTWTTRPAFTPALTARHPELTHLTALAPQGSAVLWAGCDRALCRLDPLHGTFQRFGPEQGVAPDSWRVLLATHDGALWARGDHGLLRHAPHQAHFDRPDPQPPVSVEPVRYSILTEDASGHLLLNQTVGLSRGGLEGWRTFGPANGLPGETLTAALVDHTGALWFSAVGHGLLRWHGFGDFESWTRADGLGDNVLWSIASTGGRVWIGSDQGLDRLNLGAPTGPTVSHLEVGKRIPIVALDARNHLWTVDGSGRVTDFDPATGSSRIAIDHLERVYKFLIDRRQRVWVCSRKGLFFFSPDDRWSTPHTAPELSGVAAWSIAEGPDGTIWIGGRTGLFRLQGGHWSAVQLPSIAGPGYNFMLAVAPDGTLWTQNSDPHPLLHLRVEGDHALLIDQVESATFGSDNLTFLEYDRRGWLWVGSDDGVHVFNGRQWVQCTAEDGLVWDDTDFHAFLADLDGTVWIGTSSGLSHILHPERLFAVADPATRITQATLAGVDLLSGHDLRLDLRRPTLTVRLRDVNYDREAAIVQRYRLLGEENEWQEVTGSVIRVPTLDPGLYTLEVLTYDRRRHTTSPVQGFSFTLLEPWWKRWPFALLELSLFLGLLFALWRLSVRILVGRQRELERLVSARTLELQLEKRDLLAARAELIEITRRDPLTHLLNRRALFERLECLVDAAQTAAAVPVFLIMADLDRFKQINDLYGHLTGDIVLQECARRFELATRAEDLTGRYGGEEFLLLLAGLDHQSVRRRMEEIRQAIAGQPVVHGELSLNVTCSFGVACLTPGVHSIADLIGLADAALYRAKKDGRNRVAYAEQPTAALLETQPA